jgi:hypothetical protein
MLPEVSSISRMLAGTSALPEPGGGAFALTLAEAARTAITKTVFMIFMFV